MKILPGTGRGVVTNVGDNCYDAELVTMYQTLLRVPAACPPRKRLAPEGGMETEG